MNHKSGETPSYQTLVVDSRKEMESNPLLTYNPSLQGANKSNRKIGIESTSVIAEGGFDYQQTKGRTKTPQSNCLIQDPRSRQAED